MNCNEIQYEVKVNGKPDFKAIPKVTLQPIVKKLLENIIKQVKEKKSEK